MYSRPQTQMASPRQQQQQQMPQWQHQQQQPRWPPQQQQQQQQQQPAAASKNLLFFSRHCQYSSEAVTLVTQRGMREHFVFVDVDVNRSQLPACVTSVPTLITHDKRVLAGDNLFRVLRSGSQPPPQQQQQRLPSYQGQASQGGQQPRGGNPGQQQHHGQQPDNGPMGTFTNSESNLGAFSGSFAPLDDAELGGMSGARAGPGADSPFAHPLAVGVSDIVTPADDGKNVVAQGDSSHGGSTGPRGAGGPSMEDYAAQRLMDDQRLGLTRSVGLGVPGGGNGPNGPMMRR
jgi:hypothetical protein